MEQVDDIKNDYDQCVSSMILINQRTEASLKKLEAKQKEIEAEKERVRLKIQEISSQFPSGIIRFCIGGKSFVTSKYILSKHEGFFMAFLEGQVLPDLNGEYFIDRNPIYFALIYQYMRDGRVDLKETSAEDRFHLFKEFDYYLTPKPVLFEICGSSLEVSQDRRTVTKIGSPSHENCNAIALEGWNSGRHVFKCRVNNSANQGPVHWINIGVSTHRIFNQTNYHVSGTTFFHNTHDNNNGFNSGVVSGAEKQINANSIVTLDLDCDNGTLSFSIDTDPVHFVITVPKNVLLYPCAHLYAVGNSVEFVD